jgi:RHS repeat-associated protein
MIFDKTGALANVKRHDYLPFGEELMTNQGLRTPALGYGAADGVRQKFTQKERDIETGLDYFGARYYASTQGRFTGADPISIGVDRLFDPQRFNRYAYVRNNPLMFTDPDGRDIVLGSGDQKRVKKALVEIAKRPGGREVLQKLDKLTLQIMVSTGEVKGGKEAYGTTKGSSIPIKDGEKVIDAKNGSSGGLVVIVDFNLADGDRKENKKREDANPGLKAIGLEPKGMIENVPTSDAQQLGHEIAHAEAGIFNLPSTETAVDERTNGILAEPVDKNLAKDAKKFVDNLVQPNQPQPQPKPTPEVKKKTEDD